MNRHLVSQLLLLVCLVVHSTARAVTVIPTCATSLIEWLGPDYPFSIATVRAAQALAERHGLPTAVQRVGFDERPRYRLYVGLDTSNAAAVNEYFATFHAQSNGGRGSGIDGHLIVENLGVNGAWTNTPAIRTDATPQAPNWGSTGSRSGAAWSAHWGMDTDRVLINSVVPLDRERMQTVLAQLADKTLRAPTKASPAGTCTVWLSNLILGQTRPPLPVQNYFLASYLGFARTIEHDELARCMTHAANKNLPVTFVLYRGQEATFRRNLADMLPPMPKRAPIRLLHAERDGTTSQFPEAALTAARLVAPGSRVFFPIAAGTSAIAFEALLRRSRELPVGQPAQGIRVDLLLNSIPSPALEEAVTVGDDRLHMRALFVGKNMISLTRGLRMEVAPTPLGQLARSVRARDSGFVYDAIFVQTSMPDANGRVSLGQNCDHAIDVIQSNPGIKVIAAHNRHVPFVPGDGVLNREQITAGFEDNTPLPSPPVAVSTDVERSIATHLATLIPNDASLQIGIGGVFVNLPEALQRLGRQRLHLWTELFGDAAMTMLQQGTAADATASFAYGSAAMYAWLPTAQNLRLKPASTVIDPAAVAQRPNFHAINSAFQVDLDGQVNAAIDAAGQWVSSPGGQPEFMEGAVRSPGGKAIIALRSTARLGDQTVSRIAPFLYFGPITTPWIHVTHVVTEFGVAHLAGRSRSERALALIGVAHPDFRATLAEQAVRNGQLTPEQASAAARL